MSNTKKITAEEKNKELAELYQGISNLFGKIELNLNKISNLIEESNALSPRTKGILEKNIGTIFENSNSIMNSLGRLGKVK